MMSLLVPVLKLALLGYRAGVKQITFKSPLSQICHCLSIRTAAVWERLQE